MNTTNAVPNRIFADTDLNLIHLQAELARIDVLVRREVRRWQLAGQNPDHSFRGLHISDAEANRLLARPFATSWGQTTSLEPAEAALFDRAEAEARRQIESVTAQANAQGRVTRWQYLAAEFELDQFELDTLLICLAPALDLRYERLYAYLQNDVTRKQPRVNLVLDLLCGPGPNRLLELSRFFQTSNLFKFNLLEPVVGKNPAGLSLLNQTLCVDPTIVCWLLGTYRPHAKLGNHAELIRPTARITDDSFAQTQSQIDNLLGDEPVMVFWGADRLRQEEAAKSLAGQGGRALLRVNLAEVIADGVPAPDALRLALRDARLVDAVPCLLGWDACLQNGTLPSILLAELCAHPGAVIVIGRDGWRAEGTARTRRLFWVEFPMPSFADRKILWNYYLGAAAEQLNLNDIAGQFTLTAGQIRDIVASAQDRANQQNRPLQNEDIFAAARAHSSSGLARLARKIEPRYNWADIILPADQIAILKELVSTVRVRPKVLEEWGVGQKLASGAGITVLFAGPPGTGKTMAAEVVAAELGLDLYKIDLSSVVSKYVGETEKNLEKIFDEAERSNAILFFDEADDLFGKRSEVRDAHDRYANIEISYLLQRMDGYNGVTILATNLRANLDEAFTRRLQFAVDFPFPEQADVRLRIWESLFPPGVPRVPDLDLPLMAHRFKLAGGSIRNVIVSAAHLAAADGGEVTMDHLLHGLRREFQKMGRLVDEKELRLDK
ncbi:MAG: ATP-binding protein [Chloroflexi bacterium]|nr:MAG: ATP-binding protein [Chloroflexota bacterium]